MNRLLCLGVLVLMVAGCCHCATQDKPRIAFGYDLIGNEGDFKFSTRFIHKKDADNFIQACEDGLNK